MTTTMSSPAVPESALAQFDPPSRLLMGPGPINADPRVLRAMSAPLIGQFDPIMTACMNDVMVLLRQVFRTGNPQTFVVDGTSRAGIEAALVSVLAPGDRVLIPIFGRFGHLLQEIAERCGAEVHTIGAEWGAVFDPAEGIEAIDRVEPAVVAIVHGETSTCMVQPLAEIGAACRQRGVLLYTDTTASLGGNEFRQDDWGVDIATAGLQKCLAGPSGSAPISISERAVQRIQSRSGVEAGVRTEADRIPDDVIRSNYFDLGQIISYWGPRRLNHHTEATSMLYAVRECARLLAVEGMDAAVERHRRMGGAMAAGLEALGLELFGDPAHRMNNVLGVVIPAGVDGEAVRAQLLADFGIEIGSSFGPLQGRIWRVGIMGYNARRDAVMTTLAALDQVLASVGWSHPEGAGVTAARTFLDRA